METRNTFSSIKEYKIDFRIAHDIYHNSDNHFKCTSHFCTLVDIEVSQAVLLDTVFEAIVHIPYDMQIKQVLVDSNRGGSNAGTGEGFRFIPIGARVIIQFIMLQQQNFLFRKSMKFDQPLMSNPNMWTDLFEKVQLAKMNF
ncbi:hypothetical protein M9H77_12358 [Catharanthus roseus]|uniref:Uncharacterized protein n=1 Tax=Catharanthus roseus TaxID=4058 RepID=A0ACC0BHC4_CATRO|nr:hypothetical protein M9H77_12358 [Catharanthus roseus]